MPTGRAGVLGGILGLLRTLFGFRTILLLVFLALYSTGHLQKLFPSDPLRTTRLREADSWDLNAGDASNRPNRPSSATQQCPKCPVCPREMPVKPSKEPGEAEDSTCPQLRTKTRPHRKEPRSFHRCLNQWRAPRKARIAHCHFENVCIRGNGELLYFLGDSEKPVFEDPLLYLDGTEMEHPHSPTFVEGSPPKNATWYPGAVAYFHAYNPANFGHALDDDVFAAFRLLRIFRLHNDAEVLLLTKDTKVDDCKSARDANAPPACAHLRELAPFVAKDIYSVKRPPTQHNFGSKEQPMFCGRHVLAGTFRLSMGYDIEAMHDHFVEHMLCRVGLPPRSPLPDPPRIAFFEKKGRRRVLNTKSTAAALRSKLGLQVDVLDVASIPLLEQLALMSNYSIVVSPSGGISYTSTFLPPGASLVLVGAWDIENNRSFPIDRFVFTTRGRTRDYYYGPEWDEVSLNVTLLEGTNVERVNLYRDFVDVTLNADRLAKMLNSVLVDMGLPRTK